MLAGGCLCGAVRYAADGRPFHETLCHCADCRRAFGAVPVAWFSVARRSFRFVEGRPAAFRSSAAVTRRFCGTCGTSLTYEHDGLPEELDVATATLDDPDAAPPKDHVHTGAGPAWDRSPEGLPAHPGSRPAPGTASVKSLPDADAGFARTPRGP